MQQHIIYKIQHNKNLKREISVSTLEKTILLLREMPEQSLESLHDFIRSIWIYQDGKTEHAENSVDISESMEGFRVLQSFAGTLPADSDYKKELEEMREEKYARFN